MLCPLPGPRREVGQALPFLLLLLAVAVAGALAVVALGTRGAEHARARTAADAAALAGAAEGAGAARRAAAASGGTLASFASAGAQVEVEVRVGAAVARARAERLGGSGAPGVGEHAGLQPALVAALRRAEALLGEPVPITSGYRSPAEQQRLWDRRHENPFPVARPGTSRHERGLAVDVPRSFVARLRAVAPQVGLCFPLPVTDPVHFELCPGVGG